MRPSVSRAFVLGAASIVVALAAATVVVAALESPPVGIADASVVYLVPVVILASRFGWRVGLVTAALAAAVYDFLFTAPRFSLVVANAREWLEVLLFGFVALAVGRLSALGTQRAALAEVRAREAEAAFAVSRYLATEELEVAIPALLARTAQDAGLDRAWVVLEPPADQRPIADTRPDAPIPWAPITDVLGRTPGDEPARWIRAHLPARTGRPAPTARGGDPGRGDARGDAPRTPLRVRIEADGETLGSLWGVHPRGRPGPEETRLMALAADQLGLALHREQLRRAAVEAEISRQSDLLKSQLLTSVSHDLRTPLGGIRAAAGGLLDPATELEPAAVRQAAREIDGAAARLDRLVRRLLDLGRIESGLLKPDLEPFELRTVVDAAIARLRPTLGGRPLEIDVAETLPPVRIDGLLFDEILANLLENVARHTPAGAACRIRAVEVDDRVDLMIEDGGAGVADATAAHLFDPFARPAGAPPERRRGGFGLAVVKGFADAMGIEVAAARSDLGGLAVSLRVPTLAPPPPEAVA